MKNSPHVICDVSSKTNGQVDGVTPVKLVFSTPLDQRDGLIVCNNSETVTLFVDIVKRGSSPPTLTRNTALMKIPAGEDTDPWHIASDMEVWLLNDSGDTTKTYYTAREFLTQ
jgi:hypothetical protein